MTGSRLGRPVSRQTSQRRGRRVPRLAAAVCVCLMLLGPRAGLQQAAARQIQPGSFGGCGQPHDFYGTYAPNQVAIDDLHGRAVIPNWSSGTVNVVDTRSARVIRTTYVGGHPWSVSLDRHAHRALVVTSGGVSVLDTLTGTLVRAFSLGGFTRLSAVDEGLGRAYVLRQDGHQMVVVDMRTAMILGATAVPGQPMDLIVDGLHHRVAVMSWSDDHIRNGSLTVFDDRTGSLLYALSVASSSSSLTLDRRTGRIFLLDQSGLVTVLDPRPEAHQRLGRRLAVRVTTIRAGDTSYGPMVVDATRGRAYLSTGSAIAVFGTARDGSAVVVRQLPATDLLLGLDPATGRLYTTPFPPARVASTTDTIAVRDPGSGALIRTLEVGESPRLLALDTRTNHLFVVTGEDTLSMLDATSGAVMQATALGALPVALAVDEGSGRAYTANYDGGTVSILSPAGDAVQRTVTVGSRPNALAIVPGRHPALIVTTLDGAATLLDAATGAVRTSARLGRYPFGVVVDQGTANGPARAYSINCGDDSVSVLDAASGVVVRTVALHGGAFPWAVAIDRRRGRLVVARAFSGTVTLLDARTGWRAINVQGGAWLVAVDSRARRICVASGATVALLDLDTGRLLHSIPIGSPPEALAVDESAGRLYVSYPGYLAVIATRGGKVLQRGRIGGAMLAVDQPTRHVFMADQEIYRGKDRGIVRLLDSRTGALLRTIVVGRLPRAIALDRRRWRLFVANAFDDTVSVLDTRTGTVLHTVHLAASP